jgi:hypothetical protein
MTAVASAPKFFVQHGQFSMEKLNEIPCPNLRMLVNEGFLRPDKDGFVWLTNLEDVLRRVAGKTGLVNKILVGGAGNVTKEVLAKEGAVHLSGIHTDKFAIFKLRGSSLDHVGDSRVLRDAAGPSEARLEWFKSFASSEDHRLGFAELAQMQDEASNEPGTGLRGRGLGVLEFAAILRAYGTPSPVDGRPSLSLDGLEQIYIHATLPDEFRAALIANNNQSPNKAGIVQLIGDVTKMLYTQLGTHAGNALAGLFNAADRPGRLDQTSALSLARAICPAGPPVALPKSQADQAHKRAGN